MLYVWGGTSMGEAYREYDTGQSYTLNGSTLPLWGKIAVGNGHMVGNRPPAPPLFGGGGSSISQCTPPNHIGSSVICSRGPQPTAGRAT